MRLLTEIKFCIFELFRKWQTDRLQKKRAQRACKYKQLKLQDCEYHKKPPP